MVRITSKLRKVVVTGEALECCFWFWVPQYKRCGLTGESPVYGHEDGEETGPSVIKEEIESWDC